MKLSHIICVLTILRHSPISFSYFTFLPVVLFLASAGQVLLNMIKYLKRLASGSQQVFTADY